MFRFIFVLCFSLCVVAADQDDLWDFDQPALSAKRFRTAIQRAEQAGDAATRGELLTQLARAEGLQGKFPEGNQILDTLRDGMGNLPPVVSVRYVLERGRLINSAGEPRRAWRWFRAGFALAQRNNLDFYAVDALHMLGITDTGKAALDWNTKAIELAQSSSDIRAQSWLGSLYNNQGWAYHDQKNYPKALEYLRLAQTWQEQHVGGRPLLVARWGLAKVLREAGEPDKALAIQLDVERALDKVGEKDGYVYEEIAENLLLLTRRDESRAYFGRAFAALSSDEWLRKTEPNRLARMRQLSQ